MIRKLATIPGLRFLAILITVPMGIAVVHAQQPSAQQPPAAQPQPQQQPDQSGSQEASPEEIARPRKKPLDYKKWSFNVGGGASLPYGTTDTYVRGGGGIGAVGVARNYSKYFGLRLDFQFDNLPLRTSALQAAQAPGATDHVYSLVLGPIINVPVSTNWGGYIIGGLGYFHRSGK